MKKKTGIILNLVGIALILALLCMLFVPYFPAAETGIEKQSAQNVSIMGYVMHPLDKVTVAPVIAQNNANLGETAPNSSNYVVPVLTVAVVGLLSIIAALILRKKLLPGLAFLLTGALALGTFIADLQYAIGGWAYVVILLLAAALTALGVYMVFILIKELASDKTGKILPLVLAGLTLITLLVVFAINIVPTSITASPATVGAEVANNPYLAENVSFALKIVCPSAVFVVLLITLLLSIYFCRKLWMTYVYGATGLFTLVSLVFNHAYNCVFIQRSFGIAAALLLLILSVLYALTRFRHQDAASEKKRLSKKELDAVIFCSVSVLLILVILCTMFTVVVTPVSVTVTVRAMGETAETNPYLAKWVSRMPGPGAATLASPSWMALVLFAIVLLNLVYRKSDKMFFLNIGVALISLYTLLSNRVFAPNPLRMCVAVPAAGILLLLAVVFMIRYLLNNRNQNIAGINYANLIVLLIVVVLMFLPYWNVEDAKSSKTPTRSIASLVTMRSDKLPMDEASLTAVGAKIKSAFKTAPKKTVSDIAGDTGASKKVLDAVTAAVTPVTILDTKLNSVINAERTLVAGEAAQPYTANAEGLWFIPVMLMAASALFLLLCLLRADEGWTAFLSLLVAAAGIVIFVTFEELHFSNLCQYILGLYAFVFVASFVNIAEYIAQCMESKRDREKYIYDLANEYSATGYRIRAAHAMKGNAPKAVLMTLIHFVVIAAILASAWFSFDFMVRSFTDGGTYKAVVQEVNEADRTVRLKADFMEGVLVTIPEDAELPAAGSNLRISMKTNSAMTLLLPKKVAITTWRLCYENEQEIADNEAWIAENAALTDEVNERTAANKALAAANKETETRIMRSINSGKPLLFIIGCVLIAVCMLLFGYNIAAFTNAMVTLKRTGKLSLMDYVAVFRYYKLGVFNGVGLKLLLFPNLGFVIYFAAKAVMDLCGKPLSPIVYVIAAAFEIYGVYLSYKQTMMPYIQYDNAHFTANESAEGSVELIKRNKWQTFCLDLSYAGWYLLCLLTGGILLLWVYPRHQLARAYYYDNLIEERDRVLKAHK